MKQFARFTENSQGALPGVQPPARLSFLKFLFRYPIFLLAFGPPIFRSGAGIDATKGNLDFWSFYEVAWIGAIVLRAILRLLNAKSILMPRQIRSVLKFAFSLGLLFLISTAYSPSRLVTTAYSILYFLTMICVVEFIVDVYHNPPDWMQCLFHLRFIAILLLALVLLTILFNPAIVITIIPGGGLRLGGGAVAPATVICPMIALISAYSFLFSLESKAKSSFFFLVGLAGTLATQSRGAELALFLSLAILGLGWAKASRRSAYTAIFGLVTLILFSSVTIGAVGGRNIWEAVNRGEHSRQIADASGRTEIWSFVLHYCMAHPQGMGYIAGFRILFKQYFALGMDLDPTGIGNAHNSFIDILAGAGWLALAVYLILLSKIVALGWRFAKRRTSGTAISETMPRHALRCTLLLLVSFFAGGMDTALFSVPLQECFYLQNIIIAIILGISARFIADSRVKSMASPQGISRGSASTSMGT